MSTNDTDQTNYAQEIDNVLAQLKEAPENLSLYRRLGYLYDRDEKYSDAIKTYVGYFKRCKSNNTEIDPRLRTSMLWCITKRLKELDSHSKDFEKTLEHYLTSSLSWTKGAETPSHPYSLLLLRLSYLIDKNFDKKKIPFQIAESYLRFVSDWNLVNLRIGDFTELKSKDGKSFPSLCERIVSTLYYAACIKNPLDQTPLVVSHPWCADFILKQVERFPKQTWFPYYYGKLMIMLGKPEAARGYYIAIAKAKMGEFWIWQGLAETFTNQEEQIACLCRALICKIKEESYLVNTHELLANVLRTMGMNAEALFEYQQVDRIRKQAGWSPKKRDNMFDVWAKQTIPRESNTSLYKKYAPIAESFVIEAFESADAVIISRFTMKKENIEKKKVGIGVFVKKSNCIKETVVAESCLGSLTSTPLGTPITSFFEYVDGKPYVRKVILRENGTKWDIYPRTLGIVTHRDEAKGKIFVLIGKESKSCCLDMQQMPGCKHLAVGDFIEAICSVRNGDCLSFAKVNEPSVLPPFIKKVSGTLRQKDGCRFGFVDDAFVPPYLLEGYTDGDTVSGVAAYLLDKKKGKMGWRIIAHLNSLRKVCWHSLSEDTLPSIEETCE